MAMLEIEVNSGKLGLFFLVISVSKKWPNLLEFTKLAKDAVLS